MRIRLDTLSLVALLAWSPPAIGAEAAPPRQGAPAASPGEEVVDWDPERDPPPGAPADVALWRAGRQATFDALASRREASRLQRHVRGQRLVERLAEAAAKRPEAEATALLGLQARLKAGWSENYGVMARQWPVDVTRVCGYPWLYFESALRAEADRSKNSDLVAARQRLRTCVDNARTATGAMVQANARLAPIVAEAEKALGAAGPGAPAAAAEPREGTPEHERLEGEAPHQERRKPERHEHGAKRD